MSKSISELAALLGEGWSICIPQGGPALLQCKDLSACPIALTNGQASTLVRIWQEGQEGK